MNEVKKVLLVGIDPKLINFDNLPENIDSELIRAEAIQANKRLTELGYEIYNCFTDLGETAASTIVEILKINNFDCIMIGAGIRTINEHLFLFEKIINVIHSNAPKSKICFNTRPLDSVEAVQRWT
ncbi:MAG: hypothetical protein SFV55_13645 [Haliscomenobacter sp.]|uniref:hypothetical protein n=1 Tax=Haliscomenobacter sp. TaxID=2717303 RepID=UPI0029AA8E4B|nr:hypothetical protein [Haliscomenobacter sp.]MDX2069465.1 hypothetical protein [Haliscomenobacter sp.]